MGRMPSTRPRNVADLVLADGRPYPASLDRGERLSLAVANGRIAYLGPEEGLAPWLGPRTRRIDLDGKTVLPGFVDAHLHPLLGGLRLLECDLAGLVSLADCQRAVRTYANEHPDLPFIRGGGWSLGAFPEGGPSKEMLDAAVPDRPAFLKAMDGHSLWANRLALQAAGIHAGTPPPPGGCVEMDPRTGEPTGWLKEWSAMALVESRFPAATPGQRMAGAREFMRKAARAGITSVSDAMLTEAEYRAYSELDRRGELTVRVHGMALCRPDEGDDGRQAVRDLLRQPRSPRLQARAVKLFLDGVVESHTAWLNEPYADRPRHRGTLIWPEEAFMREVSWWDAQGVPVHVHAIGDGAARLAVDAIEAAIRSNGRREARHQITHLDMVRREEVDRMARLGILAVVQPAWCHMDHSFFDATLPFLGRERASRLYPLHSMLRAGVAMACGSDLPFGGDTAAFAPLEGIQVGATRVGLDGDYPAAYGPEERAPLRDLLDAYTRGGALAQFRETEFGSLREGMRADLAVLDRNLFDLDLREVRSARVVLTLVEGREVFRDAKALTC